MKYYLISGEASGDLHASNLMKALLATDCRAEFRFYGGDLMQGVGGTMVRHYRELAYMGFVPVLTHLPTILRNMSRCKADIVEWGPDAVILVDYPGFNLDIARYVHSQTQIPVFYYISPKVWAWKEYRIKNLRRDVDVLLSILPFETDYFRRHQCDATYVGNPCVDAIDEFRQSEYGHETFAQFTSANQLGSQPIIAILAGSRKQEIRDNLRIMLQATAHLTSHQMVIAGAPGIDPSYYRRYIPAGRQVSVVFGQTYRLLAQAEAALVTSGTATLETALLKVPQVVCYYTAFGRFISLMRRMLLKVKYISLVNLIADREVVAELVAEQMTATNVRQSLEKIMEGGDGRQAMLDAYDDVIHRLGSSGASRRAADIIVKKLTQQR